jgi:mannose-6-phosphate isomerase-like protein (cupin superfamily)
MSKVSLSEKLALFADHWAPRTIAALNDYEIKVARLKGEFVWHRHVETDELFLVLKGTLRMGLRDGDVELGPGDLYVVPRGVEHRPVADDEVEVLLIEPANIVNTGDAGGALTAPRRVL